MLKVGDNYATLSKEVLIVALREAREELSVKERIIETYQKQLEQSIAYNSIEKYRKQLLNNELKDNE